MIKIIIKNLVQPVWVTLCEVSNKKSGPSNSWFYEQLVGGIDKTSSNDKKKDLIRQVNCPTIYYDSIISKTSSDLNSKPKLKLLHRIRNNTNLHYYKSQFLKIDLLFWFHCWILVHRRLAENKNWAILPTCYMKQIYKASILSFSVCAYKHTSKT